MLCVHDSDADFRHLIAVEGIVFCVDADHDSVLCELVCDRAGLGNIVIFARLHANPAKSEAVTKDIDIFDIWLCKTTLQLVEGRG
jgi:hypothetical protein